MTDPSQAYLNAIARLHVELSDMILEMHQRCNANKAMGPACEPLLEEVRSAIKAAHARLSAIDEERDKEELRRGLERRTSEISLARIRSST